MATIPDEKFSALGWFNGYSMYQISKSQRNSDGSVNITASANYLGLVDVSGSLQAQFKNFGATSVTNYAIAIRAYDASPKYRFDPLDNPAQIVAWAKTAASTTFNAPASYSSVLSQALPSNAVHEQVFAAMPSTMCDHSIWSANPVSIPLVGTIRVVGERVIPLSKTQPLPSCALSVSFIPDNQVWADPTGSVINVAYALDTKIADKILEVSASPVAFNTSNYPSMQPALIGPSGFKVTALGAGPGNTVEWNLNEVLNDDPGDPIDRTKPIVILNQPVLANCVPSTGALGIPANGAQFANGVVAIKIQQYFASTPDPSSAQNGTCTVALTLRFQTGKGNIVAAALPPNTMLMYPASTSPAPATFSVTSTPPTTTQQPKSAAGTPPAH